MNLIYNKKISVEEFNEIKDQLINNNKYNSMCYRESIHGLNPVVVMYINSNDETEKYIFKYLLDQQLYSVEYFNKQKLKEKVNEFSSNLFKIKL
jgi:hypothetical protein